jgi:leucyl-tRNA---protein transferase
MDNIISIPLWLTTEQPCSYLPDTSARSAVVSGRFDMNTAIYAHLIDQGFRRSGDQVYKPHCPSCQSCIATRLNVSDFQPDRKQKRCLKRNSETSVNIKPAVFDPAHFALYQRYQAARHDKADKEPTNAADYIEFLGSSWCDTWFVEFSRSDQLMAIAIVDVLENALSAVYTFFDPQFAAYSPGVYAVLWQIELAKQLDLDYLYLGFWIKNCRKMCYKIQYQPLQGLLDQKWQLLTNQP